ncbi:GntR family transcriptional regulator [Fimbriiglobus ruber]|uniref:Transcriptional regulator, GntR family n=1 Tax=Fimbriiglobus ruber TaxID=1908690 RepID=A0A225DZL3_9BACT|nr:GntR family transcriptional regulator [Fimbriiglobus ruber]OWK46732.1 Transcriptional regulator, GntR family [Fimbriiglobus ruber]
MRLRVLADSTIPIYEQIVSQVVFAIAAGDVSSGELVPSVRDLSQQLLVNPNTVARAFQELERAGILESRRGLGMAVTAEAPKLCAGRRKEIVRGHVRDALRAAAAAGLSAPDVHELVDDEWPRLAPRNGRAESSR